MTRLTAKLLIAASFAGAVALAAPASAKPNVPVTVTVTTNNGGVQVGTGLPGQPLVGASADDNGVCAGFSLQQEQCLPGTIK